MPHCSNNKCHSKGASGGALLTCGACGSAQYCSKECQRADWKAGHKLNCRGTKLSAIAQALEICLLGVNNGGKANEQIARIRSVLEQSDVALTAPDQTSDQEHLENLLLSVYIPPIVQISERSFAVFSPGVFLGVYPSREAALRIVVKEYIAFADKTATTICGPHMFQHPLITSGGMPRLNWAEHCLMAVYLGMYDKALGTEELVTASRNAVVDRLQLNKPASLPRAEVPEGIFFPVLSEDKTKLDVVPYCTK